MMRHALLEALHKRHAAGFGREQLTAPWNPPSACSRP